MKKESLIINHIARNIYNNLSIKPSLDISLLGSDFGRVIFLLFAANNGYFDEDKAFFMLDKVMVQFRKGHNRNTYCDGTVGYFLGMELLEEKGFISGFKNALPSCFNILEAALYFHINDNFDFLHGATGVGLYLAKKMNDSPFIASLVDNLLMSMEANVHLSERGSHILFKNSKGIRASNLSLSHGIASVIVFLCRVYRSTDNYDTKVKCRDLTTEFFSYLSSNFINAEVYGSFTPSVPLRDGDKVRKSRLGWCYGDIGTVVALRAVKNTFDIEEAGVHADLIIEHILTRRLDAESNYVFDAGLCHGASGIIQFIKTCEHPAAAVALEYWKGVRENMLKSGEDSFYFGKYQLTSNKIVLSSNLLEGDAGIALSLMEENEFINKVLLYEE